MGAVTVRWLTAFLDRPASSVDTATDFWTRVTGSSLSPVRGDRGEFATLLPPDGDAFLRVQTLVAGAGRSHLDVHVDDVPAAAGHAVALGASAQPRDGYVELASPAGFVWCLVPADGASRRPAPQRRDGVASLVDQLCLDVPPAAFETECAFWAAVTGWSLLRGSRPEFAVLARPEGMPLRLLLQRLDDDPPGGAASGHLDLACTDVAREVALHRAWGADVVATFPAWTTLRDPSGVLYCITRRDPLTGTLPPS
jgi:Glyoxalase-like domain